MAKRLRKVSVELSGSRVDTLRQQIWGIDVVEDVREHVTGFFDTIGEHERIYESERTEEKRTGPSERVSGPRDRCTSPSSVKSSSMILSIVA
ncbi:hypothetical protein [Haloprofundus salinisoli]|uniref:hypothetical protein n=1 Tax=Haloprofundus salinisoli TaxID=2876193 RepID=UPI001CC9F257|nr:hypothetical protein [Haloprofundus salinisoli]